MSAPPADVPGYQLHKDPAQLRLDPVTDTADACIIWLHGLGACMSDLLPLATALQLPCRTRMFFLQAPELAVTINDGQHMPAWYDITSLGPDGPEEDSIGLDDSARRIHTLIKAQEAEGIPAARIVLAGFSQGGALGLYAGLQYPQALAGLLVLSGYLPPATLITQPLPTLFLHGTEDDIIPVHYARLSHDILQQQDCPTCWREYPGGHTVSPEALPELNRWLQECLPGGDSA